MGTNNMFARVTIGEGKPENIDTAIQNFKEQVGPVAKTITGFKGSYFLVDRRNGKIMGIALWDTEEHLQASIKAAQQLSAGVTQAAAATKPPTVEVYEVAVHL
jgi:heme-degrading monooxygenase HmoA